jgi:hypothetical protein
MRQLIAEQKRTVGNAFLWLFLPSDLPWQFKPMSMGTKSMMNLERHFQLFSLRKK